MMSRSLKLSNSDKYFGLNNPCCLSRQTGYIKYSIYIYIYTVHPGSVTENDHMLIVLTLFVNTAKAPVMPITWPALFKRR